MTGALFADRPFTPPPPADGETHPERAPRTNLLLSATIETSFGETPARVRNLSEGGAMVECAEPPTPGERLMLKRSALTASATCVWRNGARFGIRFDRPIAVQHWATGMRPAASPGQQRIDAIQASLRAGQAVAPASPSVMPSKAAVLHNVADEIGAAAKVLRALSDRLADDIAVVAAHGEALQHLDPLAQTLDHLARILTAGDPGVIIDAIGMDDLRARLTRPPSC